MVCIISKGVFCTLIFLIGRNIAKDHKSHDSQEQCIFYVYLVLHAFSALGVSNKYTVLFKKDETSLTAAQNSFSIFTYIPWFPCVTVNLFFSLQIAVPFKI